MYRNADAEVLYVGKAKNLRRRLQNYRNASRRRVHRKMRVLVSESYSLEIQTLSSEREALLRENELIVELSPIYNVDGAYAFLYPSIGVGETDNLLVLCFSTQPEKFTHLGLTWYGCYRSRPRTKVVFDSLVQLLSLLGHLEKRTRLPTHESLRGSRVVGVRMVPAELIRALHGFFAGSSSAMPGLLATWLLKKPRARREASFVQGHLKFVNQFFETDTERLHHALRKMGKEGTFIPQEERDALFIQAAEWGEDSEVP